SCRRADTCSETCSETCARASYPDPCANASRRRERPALFLARPATQGDDTQLAADPRLHLPAAPYRWTRGVPLQQWVPRLVPRLRRATSRDLPLAQPLAERLWVGAAGGADALSFPGAPALRPPGQESRGGLCGDPGAAGLDAQSGGAFRQVGGCARCVHRRYRGHAGDDGLREYPLDSAAFACPA